MTTATDVTESKVPARMDRLPWSRWHWFMVASLGIVWILDGLEVTIKGSLGPTLKTALGFTNEQVGLAATIYLIGAVTGALLSGWATDRWGRRRVFIFTITIYMVGVLGTGLVANGFVTFALFRFITGFGIGGEYAGINSAIDELMPARMRGRVALAINGSYWIGTLIASGLATLYLATLPPSWAWRVGFLTGASLAVGIVLLRRYVPESPRWLVVHGREQEAEEVVSGIERSIEEETGERLTEPPEQEAMRIAEREPVSMLELPRIMFGRYPRRAALGGTLLTTQAFLYNAIFFTYGIVLTTYFGVAKEAVALYLIPFAIGNFAGPVLMGPLFDKVGRKPMISGTFLLAGGLLAALGWLFNVGIIQSSLIFTLGLTIIFFFASAAASSGYLTVSETFPLEIRAQAIGFFYVVGTLAGGVIGPWLFGNLIVEDQRWTLFVGYLIGAGLMVIGGLTEILIGFKAGEKSLEDITDPLSVELAKEQDKRLEGPLGLDPTDTEAIRSFQEANGVDVDGIIGPKTMGALRARLAGSEEADGSDMAVDITDPDSVRRFQERYGLRVTGQIDQETQGALIAVDREPVVDPCDEESVRRFQRAYGLDTTGLVDHDTQAALRAIRHERSIAGGTEDLDAANPASIRRFQDRYDMEKDGVIGPRMRGALKARRALDDLWGGLDITDPEVVRGFQRSQGLEESGAIDAETREVLSARFQRRKREREQEDTAARGRPGFDPAEAASIKRFQTAHGLEANGIVDERTIEKLREVRAETLGVDPTVPETIERFQREHGLEPTGRIDARTQGALQAAQQDHELPDPEAEPEEPEGEALQRGRSDEPRPDVDPTDPDSIRTFQAAHGLDETGTVDAATQVALRVVEIERERQADEASGAAEAPPATDGGRPYAQRGMWAAFTYVPATPDVDRDLETEIAEIAEVLEERGPMSRSRLRQDLRAERWGPGRFRQAFNIAVEEGRIERDRSGDWRAASRERSGAS